MKKHRILITLILAVIITVSGCIPGKNPLEESEVSEMTYNDYVAPDGEILNFGTIDLQGEADKTRAISIYNPEGELPVEDCIVYINMDYDRQITVPDYAYCIKLEKKVSTSFEVAALDVKSIEANSGNYLIFIGDYNIEFARIVYAQGKTMRINGMHRVSTVVYYPSVLIGESFLRINGSKPNFYDGSEGVYLFDTAYGRGYAQTGSEPFVQFAVVKDKIAYIGGTNEPVAIPGADGYLLCFYGDAMIKQADSFTVGQTAESFYLNIKKGSLYTLSFGDKEMGINTKNSARWQNTTVIFMPDYGLASTKTNEWGYEYTISGGVITAITVPAQENSGNAVIPEDGYVISTLVETAEYKLLKDLKIGDKVELKEAENIYKVSTLPFVGFNMARGAGVTVIYNSQHGTSTRTNEWGYEIIVDENGKIIGESGNGNAAIPSKGFVLSGSRSPNDGLIGVYLKGASVIVDKDKLTYTVVFTPMDDYNNSLIRFNLLKEKAGAAKSSLLDIDHAAVGELIKEIEQQIEKQDTASWDDMTKYQNAVVAGVKRLHNLMIPSLAVEDRGAWHVLGEKNDNDVLQTVKAAVSLGLNYFIIDTWANGYAYYHTQLEGVLVHPSFTEFDPLEAFVRIGHQHGLQIHSSFSVFMAGGRKGNFPENHPTKKEGWLTLSRTGYNYGINGDGEFYTLDPHNPEVREYVIEVFKEVASRYDVDGIHYDYIRFPQPHPTTGDFGYNEGLKKAFQKEYKTTVDPVTITEGHALWADWCKFRCDVISSFVKECTVEVKKIDSSVMVTAAVFAGMEEMTTSIFQDARIWVSGGYIDGLYPMLYTPATQSFEKYAKRAVSATGDKAYLHMGLGTFEYYPNDTILWEIEYSRTYNAGICFFTLDSIISQQYNTFIRDGAFKRKAVTTDSEEAFSVAVDDLLRRIDEVYIPFSDGYDDKLTQLKDMLGSLNESNIAVVKDYAQANLGGAVLERVTESLIAIEKLTINKGFSLKIK